MRWEEERYVRVYTRDTPEWCLLSWEARALFLMLLRAVDRAGILPLGKSGTRSLAAMLRVPLEVVARAFPELVADGCCRMTPDGLSVVVPNYIQAQEAHASDRARAKAARERARARATGELAEEPAPPSHGVTDPSHGVTDPSHGVTSGHTASHGVTPCCADPCRAVPSHADPDPDPPPPPPGRLPEAPVAKPDPTPGSASAPAGKGKRATVKAPKETPCGVLYARAFTDGIRAGAPDEAFGGPTTIGGATFGRALAAHAPGIVGENLLEWIRQTAAEWHRSADSRYVSGWSWQKFVEWLESGRAAGSRRGHQAQLNLSQQHPAPAGTGWRATNPETVIRPSDMQEATATE